MYVLPSSFPELATAFPFLKLPASVMIKFHLEASRKRPWDKVSEYGTIRYVAIAITIAIVDPA